MTEQEKRRIEIEEMAQKFIEIDEDCSPECGNYDEPMDCTFCTFSRFYDAGYRKEEKVRKEVFEKIYQRLKEIKVVENNCTGHLIIGAIQDLEEEFGVEADEE